MDMGGIVPKLESHAQLLAFLASGYARFQEDGTGLTGLINQYTNFSQGVGKELQRTLSDTNLLQQKLLHSSHMYSFLFKAGAGLWLLGELGIFTKYKTVGKHIAIGAGAAAITLPGSGGEATGGSSLNSGFSTRRSNVIGN